MAEDQGKDNRDDKKPETFQGLFEEAAKTKKRRIDKALGDSPDQHPRRTISDQAKDANQEREDKN